MNLKTNWLEIIPTDIKYYIYKIYFKRHILCLIQKYDPCDIWIEPSSRLSSLVEDFGCLQTGNNVINNVFNLLDTHYCIYGKDNKEKCHYNGCGYIYKNLLDKNGHIICEDCKNIGWPCLTCGNLHSTKIGVLCKWTCTKDPFRRDDYYFPDFNN